MFTLGINAAFHDSSACLVKDGVVVAAAEEERFTRIKHGKRPTPFSAYELPFHAIDFCLGFENITLDDVDAIAYSFDPQILLGTHGGKAEITLPLEPSAQPKNVEWESVWDPLFLSYIVNAPRHLRGGIPHHLTKRLRNTKAEQKPWIFVEHHLAHDASAFLPSPFEEAAILTLDGRGERASTAYSIGRGTTIERLQQVNMPHSLGLFYEEVTSYLGFLHSSDEYKVMALASFGKPRYADHFRQRISVFDNGSYSVAPLDLIETFGPARTRGSEFTEHHFDIASSMQLVLEETVLKLSQWLHKQTGSKNLCLAGGVALNCVMNARIRDEGPFSNVWIQPAAGDAGTSLGAALHIDARLRKVTSRDYEMSDVYLGPSYSDAEIEKFLTWSKCPFKRMANIAEETAEILSQDLIVGWFQGRMEFGPRALGARSILASPLSESMQARLNEIKDREDFRPVAPVVMEDHAAAWFKNAARSPFMLFVNDVLPEKRTKIPAVSHVDGTARIQTVTREQNKLYYDLLNEFYRKTSVPILVNTSFNTRGEPMVCSPKDAMECFWTSPMDALVMGSYLIKKKEI